jgi:hypothetical protein
VQVAKSATDRRDGVAQPSRLATVPEPARKVQTIQASKGASALERARKRRRAQGSTTAAAAAAAANPLDLLDDMFKDSA